MEVKLKYRGRVVTDEDVTFIRDLIGRNPTASRRALSKKLCEAWNWIQTNGALRDMVCRGLMLQLHRSGLIELPPIRWRIPNPLVERRRPAAVPLDRAPLRARLADVRPLKFRQVRRRCEEALFNALIEEHHYLGYTQPVGEHLKFLIYARSSTPLACMAWSSAPRHIGCRDRFIGWCADERRRNLHFLAYNCRFLILPWVMVPHLASHILGRMARLISDEWQRVYYHPLHFLETFVDPGRFRGTCYRAANWIYLGRTTGRGKSDQTGRANRPLKEVWGYPLSPDFREQLKGSHDYSEAVRS
jgi:hypothetical protein